MELDAEGWLNIAELIQKANARGKSITLAQLHEVVTTSDEKRFAVSEDEQRIRAI